MAFGKPDERLVVTGHARTRQRSLERAENAMLILSADDAWPAHAARLAESADVELAGAWAKERFGVECTASGESFWRVLFDLYYRDIAYHLGLDSTDAARARARSLVFAGDDTKPPKPYLLIRPIDQIYPVKIAEIAAHDARQYVRLNPLNPDKVLPGNAGWRNLRAGDRIYLVPEWAEPMRQAGYDVRDENDPTADPGLGARGRPLGYPHLVIRPTDSVWPVKIAEEAGRPASDYKQLGKINPHLLHGPDQWNDLRAGDEINLPDESWAGALRANYQIEDDPPAPPAAARAKRAVPCQSHHLDAPFADDPSRRGSQRRAEVIFTRQEHRFFRICETDDPICSTDACDLYDPREYVFHYREPAAAERGDLGVLVFHAETRQGIAGAEIELNGPEQRKATANDDGIFIFQKLLEGQYEVIASKPGFARHTGTATAIAGASVQTVSGEPEPIASNEPVAAPPPNISGPAARLALAPIAKKARVLAFLAGFPANGRIEYLGARAGTWQRLSPSEMSKYLAERKVFPPRSRIHLEWEIDHENDVLVDLRHRPARNPQGQTNPNTTVSPADVPRRRSGTGMTAIAV
jgi:hypothetical protein